MHAVEERLSLQMPELSGNTTVCMRPLKVWATQTGQLSQRMEASGEFH